MKQSARQRGANSAPPHAPGKSLPPQGTKAPSCFSRPPRVGTDNTEGCDPLNRREHPSLRVYTPGVHTPRRQSSWTVTELAMANSQELCPGSPEAGTPPSPAPRGGAHTLPSPHIHGSPFPKGVMSRSDGNFPYPVSPNPGARTELSGSSAKLTWSHAMSCIHVASKPCRPAVCFCNQCKLLAMGPGCSPRTLHLNTCHTGTPKGDREGPRDAASGLLADLESVTWTSSTQAAE